jgi:hypothetical protein
VEVFVLVIVPVVDVLLVVDENVVVEVVVVVFVVEVLVIVVVVVFEVDVVTVVVVVVVFVVVVAGVVIVVVVLVFVVVEMLVLVVVVTVVVFVVVVTGRSKASSYCRVRPNRSNFLLSAPSPYSVSTIFEHVLRGCFLKSASEAAGFTNRSASEINNSGSVVTRTSHICRYVVLGTSIRTTLPEALQGTSFCSPLEIFTLEAHVISSTLTLKGLIRSPQQSPLFVTWTAVMSRMVTRSTCHHGVFSFPV